MTCLPTSKAARRTMGRICKSLFVLGIAGSLGAQTVAQTTPSSSPALSDFQFMVRDVETQGRLIRVPVNKSVMVEFNQPVREVRVAKPEFAEVNALTPKQIIVTGSTFGTTQLIATLENGEQRVFDVAVDIELDRLIATLRTAVPRAKVSAHALLDAVVLTGQVPDAASAKRILDLAAIFSPRIVNHMQVGGTQQVVLRCTIAEVNRSITKQLGFNGWLAGADGFAVSNLNQLNPSNVGAPAGVNFLQQFPFTVGDEGIPIVDATTMSFGFPDAQLQVFVQALRENGLLRVLAEPNVMAINGREATFLAGGEIPIPVVTNDSIKVEYKEFGVRLNFTPTILDDSTIRMQIAPEVSEPDFANSVTLSGFSIPGFTTRRVETTVELGPGQTLAIGGLLNDRVRAVSRKVPALGDIPVLGALFTSVDYQSDTTELVVLVTPQLVAGVNPSQITSVPGGNFVPPNDWELYGLGQLEGQIPEDAPAMQPRIDHSWPVRPADLYADESVTQLRGPVGPASGTESR